MYVHTDVLFRNGNCLYICRRAAIRKYIHSDTYVIGKTTVLTDHAQ